MASFQDMPPPGGYPKVKFTPQTVAKPMRYRGAWIYAGITALVVGGMLLVAKHNRADRRARELQLAHAQLSELLPQLPPSHARQEQMYNHFMDHPHFGRSFIERQQEVRRKAAEAAAKIAAHERQQ